MPNEPIDVSPDTDDLDAFTELFNSKQPSPAPTEDVTPEVNSLAEDEDQTEEQDDLEQDQTDEGEPEDDSDGSKSEDPPKGKKVNRFQERINELTARAREAERARDALLAEKETKQPEPEKQSPVVVQGDEPDPDAKNPDGSEKYPLGEFDPEYIRDMARHTINNEWAARKEQEAKEAAIRQADEARAEIQSQWVERLAPVAEQHEDFLDKTLQLESTFDGLDANYSDYLVQTIKSLDHGPEVLYYFANNLDEAEKFVKMGPLHATLALGEINAMFKGQTRKETKVSKAPPPPQVNKGTSTRTVIPADTDDLDAFSQMFFKRK